MWKRFLEIFTNVITHVQRTNKLEQKVKAQEQELKDFASLTQWLVHELQRVKDEQRHLAEREADARKMLELRIENRLLKSGRQLPSTREDDDGEDDD